MSTENAPNMSDEEGSALILAGQDIGMNAAKNATALADTTLGELAILNGMLSSIIAAFALVSGHTIHPGSEAAAKKQFLRFVNDQYNANFKIGQKL